MARLLSDAQTEIFDTDYVETGQRWPVLRDQIRAQWGDGPFRFLDVGGGNGVFADRLLKEFPEATGTVLEPSAPLLAKNIRHPRKRLVAGTTATLPDERYDLICVHWLLHHLVESSYQATRRQQINTLRVLRSRLRPEGRISAYENIYDGAILDDGPGRMIYAATSMRTAAGLMRRLGANTAGVGVCYHSRAGWDLIVYAAGLRLVRFSEPDPWPWPMPRWRRIALTLKRLYTGHFWLAA